MLYSSPIGGELLCSTMLPPLLGCYSNVAAYVICITHTNYCEENCWVCNVRCVLFCISISSDQTTVSKTKNWFYSKWKKVSWNLIAVTDCKKGIRVLKCNSLCCFNFICRPKSQYSPDPQCRLVTCEIECGNQSPGWARRCQLISASVWRRGLGTHNCAINKTGARITLSCSNKLSPFAELSHNTAGQGKLWGTIIIKFYLVGL